MAKNRCSYLFWSVNKALLLLPLLSNSKIQNKKNKKNLYRPMNKVRLLLLKNRKKYNKKLRNTKSKNRPSQLYRPVNKAPLLLLLLSNTEKSWGKHEGSCWPPRLYSVLHEDCLIKLAIIGQ